LGPFQVITFTASGSGLDASACVLISQWTGRVLSQQWHNPGQLEILSYHTPDGTIIADATDPATNDLRTIDDGDKNTRRPSSPSNQPTEVRIENFIPLPTSNIIFNLSTASLATSKATRLLSLKTSFFDQVIVPAGINGPCGLLSPVLGSLECQIDTTYYK
jgi:hypothetical protein